MLQKIACAVLASCLCIEISAGQTADFMKDNPFPFGVSDSGVFDTSFSQHLGSLVPLDKEKNSQTPTESSTSFPQASFLPSGPSSTISLTPPISSTSNLSPVESFMSELNSAVYTSKILPDIFDLRELSPEAFSKSLYDYISANCDDVIHGNPHYIASAVADTIKEGIDIYTVPIVLDIYGNTFAKFLFPRGILNSSNASSLAKKYAKILEDIAESTWEKETPESKFLVIENGFVNYLKSLDHFSLDTYEDIALQFVNEVKRVANKS